MAETFDLLIRGGICVTPEGAIRADVGVREGHLTALGDLTAADAAEVIEGLGHGSFIDEGSFVAP